VAANLPTIWPGARGRDGKFDRGILVGGGRGRSGQYCEASTIGSDRYVLTPAGTVADRLAADESGVENLLLAGDWTRNGIDAGCVESAVTSGMQAARALIGHTRTFSGESTRWLTDRREQRRGM
jgi:uncharacterized protein with NAD-binding domain and iron-sulfur cluster